MSKTTSKPFHFKQFAIYQDQCPMKVGTDGVLLGAWADVQDYASALDIGTGTGVIAIMLAQRNAQLNVSAVEIDASSCSQAHTNMQQSPFAERLIIQEYAIQDFAKQTNDTFDLIVSNPPFFTGGTISESQDRNSVRHTIKLPTGDLLSVARQLLNPQGKFCVILPYIEGLRFVDLAKSYNLHCTKMTEVKPLATKAIERLLLQFEKVEKETIIDELIIQNKGRNNWTNQYIELTKAFYLKM